ncbi:MAG: hypothetical protein KF906_12860 [Actinobacteria bacterium]|nr:hypothetical protein [Actinomycetota bacterium]
MRDAERLWVLGSGVVGLVAFVAGSLAVAAPRVDETASVAVAELVRRRGRVIGGAVLSITGTGLLLWPLGAVAAAAGDEVWRSVAAASMAAWALGFGLYTVGLLLLVGVVWRPAEDGGPGDDTVRLLLDLSHLLVLSVSAPIAAVAVVATTIVGRQADLFATFVIAAAAIKVVAVVVEVVGTGRRTGWNAGGWALGVSGYASVLWFATVLAALA